jgi:hypothetical protein
VVSVRADVSAAAAAWISATESPPSRVLWAAACGPTPMNPHAGRETPAVMPSRRSSITTQERVSTCSAWAAEEDHRGGFPGTVTSSAGDRQTAASASPADLMAGLGQFTGGPKCRAEWGRPASWASRASATGISTRPSAPPPTTCVSRGEQLLVLRDVDSWGDRAGAVPCCPCPGAL